MDYCDEIGIKNDELSNIFQNVGSEYGYKTVNAEYMAFREFKCTWQRSYNWVDFRISDYLEDAPAEVIEGLARNLFDRIKGNEASYSTALKDWVTKPEFCQDHQRTFIERTYGILGSTKGVYKDLNDSLKRLQDAGLVGEIPGLYLSWMDSSGSYKAGRCSVLMKVVTLSDRLDSEEVPDFVIDYCLFTELAHLIVGYNPDKDTNEIESDALLKNFTQCSEAERYLRKMTLYA